MRARLTSKGSPAQIGSALPSITDFRGCAWHVRFVPILLQKSVEGFREQ
jgi:hypothetical protein